MVMHALDLGKGKALLHGAFAVTSESAKPRAREGWTTRLATPYRDVSESIREVMGLARHMTQGPGMCGYRVASTTIVRQYDGYGVQRWLWRLFLNDAGLTHPEPEKQ